MNNLAVVSGAEALTPEISPSRQLRVHYDSKYRIGWSYMHGAPRPCFTPTLLNNFKAYTQTVKQEMQESGGERYDFIVIASDIPGVFNLGGDLDLFQNCIENQDRQGLLDYAKSCIHVLHENITHMQLDLSTISLVQGDALGGGFEAALASNVLIAEKGAKMGFPEVLFNLFPGMGAYSILSRKVGTHLAEEMILGGKLYSSEELFDLGIVDMLAEKGDGEMAVYEYIKTAARQSNSYRALRQVKDICNPISYQELNDIVEVWVNAAFRLTAKDLKMMNRLVKRQNSVAA